jgi:hypothetical protein
MPGNTNPSIFSVPPAIAANGTLTYTPNSSAGGSATITINLKDNGGVANGGADTSVNQTFTITVNPAGGFISRRQQFDNYRDSGQPPSRLSAPAIQVKR